MPPPRRPPPRDGDATDVRAYTVELEDYTTLIEAIGRRMERVNVRLRRALEQIDRHRVGAYETDGGSVEPCDECGEMREIARAALKEEQHT